MPELILALDVGTTTARAALFTPDGRLQAVRGARLTTLSPAPGRAEQDAAAVWRTTRRLIGEVLAGAGRAPGDLAAVGVTTQRTSIVVWDRTSGRPLAPMVLWSDLRGVGRVAELGAAGYFVAPQQAAAKLEGVLAAIDAPADRLVWGPLDSWLIWKLSGGAAHVTDASQAWPTGYLDLASLAWNGALIDEQRLDARTFPRLVDTWGPIAATSARVLGAAVPIAADIADQQAALVAHGGAPGSAKVTLGTSATIDLATGGELVLRSLTAPPFVVSRVAGETRFCVEAMVLSAGSAVDWLRRVARLGGHARFEALAAQAPDAGGAAFLPALSGLGAPHGDATRRAALSGLSGAVGRPQLARAALEGVAFRIREAAGHLFEITGRPAPEVLGVDGGLTRNRTFLAILADLLGVPVRRHAAIEATAAGAALCAARGVGLAGPDEAFARYDERCEPRIGPDESAARFAAWRRAVYGEG